MSCKPIKFPEGTAIVCSRGRVKVCCVVFCGKPHTALCDYPVVRRGVKTTCDSPVCDQHRHAVGDNLDWCQGHWDHEQRMKDKENL